MLSVEKLVTDYVKLWRAKEEVDTTDPHEITLQKEEQEKYREENKQIRNIQNVVWQMMRLKYGSLNALDKMKDVLAWKHSDFDLKEFDSKLKQHQTVTRRRGIPHFTQEQIHYVLILFQTVLREKQMNGDAVCIDSTLEVITHFPYDQVSLSDPLLRFMQKNEENIGNYVLSKHDEMPLPSSGSVNLDEMERYQLFMKLCRMKNQRLSQLGVAEIEGDTQHHMGLFEGNWEEELRMRGNSEEIIEELKAELDQKNQIKELEESPTKTNSHIDELRATINDLQDKMTKQQSDFDRKMQTKNQEFEESLARTNSHIDELRAINNDLQDKMTKQQSEFNEKIQKTNKEFEQILAQKNADITDLKANNDDLQNQIVKQQSEFDRKMKEKDENLDIVIKNNNFLKARLEEELQRNRFWNFSSSKAAIDDFMNVNASKSSMGKYPEMFYIEKKVPTEMYQMPTAYTYPGMHGIHMMPGGNYQVN